ncbi:hypothetical protein K6119_11385 [Paracrocinitomix mangrovi]|uniref:hypothetical protein n=1 Tax=Paracrocinitomix mangrovi TaxID=2862509 RepID=UPI001C8D6174|nr:hypothetical protein [Paracrocinitomix mangrovi]UKN00337.1 hypothetical protein K6119_11385 [Paracrocinitomix mangrovi]
MKIPSLKFSLFLFVILVIPYAIKLKFKEPYPAVILPSGHSQIDVDNSITRSQEYHVFVYSQGAEKEVTVSDLFPTIPKHIAFYVVKDNLGFPTTELKESERNSFKNYIIPGRLNKHLKQDELKEYYTESLGYAIDSIKTTRTEYVRDYMLENPILETNLIDSSIVIF